MSVWESDTRDPKDCPDPSVHGNPFRYCPYCSWMEEPTPMTFTDPNRPLSYSSASAPPVITDDAVQEALDDSHLCPIGYCFVCDDVHAIITTVLADREQQAKRAIAAELEAESLALDVCGMGNRQMELEAEGERLRDRLVVMTEDRDHHQRVATWFARMLNDHDTPTEIN